MLREYSGRNSKGVDKKATWMAQVEERVTDACPELEGHMDWDTVSYLYMTGVVCSDAARRIIESHRKEGAA